MKISIVTDSTADIPEEIAKENHIHVVPNILVINGKNYADGVDITRQDFYRQLPSMQSPPTTATASSGTYSGLFENLLKEGAQKILSIHVSKKFSGVINAVNTAAESFGDKVCIIDSEQVTLGLGFQVIEAARLALQNFSLETILERIEEIRPRIRVYAMLDTLEYLHRSGRVSWARARIGNLLHVKPFLEVTAGQARRLGDVRTRRKGMERLLELIEDLGELTNLAVLHSNAEDDALWMLNAYQGKLEREPLVVNVTTTIGTHVGPNGLGFAAVIKRASQTSP